MHKFKLLKDLPSYLAGTIFTSEDYKTLGLLHPLNHYPDWFELIDDNTEGKTI